jgi:Replication-relaxation
VNLRPPLPMRAVAVLLLIAKLGFVSQDQVRRWLFAGSASPATSQRVLTGRVLQRLRAAKLIDVLPRAIGGPGGGSATSVYAITTAGTRLAATYDPSLAGGRAARGPFLMRHSLAVTDALLAFHESATANDHELTSWETTWQLALKLGQGRIVPDAHFVYRTSTVELEALLEVDLGTEGSRFFAGKIARYLALWRSGSWRGIFTDWPVVLIIASTEARARLLKQATESTIRSQPDRLQVEEGTEFCFAVLSAIVSDGPLADIWHVAGSGGTTGLLTDVLTE